MLQKQNETLRGRTQRLTWGFADVTKVRAAAVGGEAVLVTPAAGNLIVKRRIAAISARRGDLSTIWRVTQGRTKSTFEAALPLTSSCDVVRSTGDTKRRPSSILSGQQTFEDEARPVTLRPHTPLQKVGNVIKTEIKPRASDSTVRSSSQTGEQKVKRDWWLIPTKPCSSLSMRGEGNVFCICHTW